MRRSRSLIWVTAAASLALVFGWCAIGHRLGSGVEVNSTPEVPQVRNQSWWRGSWNGLRVARARTGPR